MVVENGSLRGGGWRLVRIGEDVCSRGVLFGGIELEEVLMVESWRPLR